MRILFTALSGVQQPTGICRAAVNLVRALKGAKGFCEVILFVGQWQRRYFEEQLGCSALGAEIATVNIANNSVSRNWWYVNVLPKFARARGVDLVHTGFPVPAFRSRFHCPLVTTLHDLYPYDRPENFGFARVLWNRAFLRQSLRACDRVICVSRFTQTRLRCYFPLVAEKSVCIPNEIATPAIASALPSGLATPFILTVAQHRANKRLELLIEVFDKAKAAGIVSASTRMVIVGAPGPETQHLKAQVARLSLEDQVLFLSNLPDSELTALYRQCDLYISLSDIEGFGLPIGEALQCGARVLASDIAAHREVGGDRCDYVELSQPPDLNRLLTAFKNALRRPLPAVRERGQSSAGEKVLQVYRELTFRTAHSNEALGKSAASH